MKPSQLFPSRLLAISLAAAVCAQSPTAPSEGLRDADVRPFQKELLKLAFGAASEFPLNPHRKNRALAQEKVVIACFELGLPDYALAFAPRVEGWRRGAAYADYAWECAKAGLTAKCEQHLALAQRVVDEHLSSPDSQQWRVDRIRMKMARALDRLGRRDEAVALAAKVDPTTGGAVDLDWSRTVAAHAGSLTEKTARAELARITESFADQSLGEQFTSLMLTSAIHERFFADRELRELCEERLLERFVKMPPNLRMDAMAELAQHHADAGNADGAREILRRMTELLESLEWRPQDRTPEIARIAELRIAIGDRDRAEHDVDAAVAAYQAERDDIVDIYRCETLRPLALAYHALGNAEQADAMLQLALEEGMENPNSRPRCFDLVETCIEMAKRSVEPSETLWNRMREVRGGLAEPW